MSLPSQNGFEALASGAVVSPFTRLKALLAPHASEVAETIDLTLGEPRETMPPFIAAKVVEAEALFAKYPAIRGSEPLRAAIAGWLGRRFGLEGAGAVDPEREVLPTLGSREGLYFAAIPAVGRRSFSGRPAILIVNPFYQAYFGAALATAAEPVFLNATARSGHLPDLDDIASRPDLLARTAALYLCSPANPQGAVADADYIRRALELARAHDFMLFLDECYSEIYASAPPVGGLSVAAATPARFRNLVVFNSLSKRSNLPGLRSGFCAGDGEFLSALAEVRNLVGPTMAGPIQHASASAWSDEAHVAMNRDAYQAKFDVADRLLAGRFGYERPAGGFFLWLDVSQLGGGVQASVTIWKRCGVRVIPGAYLAQPGLDGTNPGADYVRVALVADPATIGRALERIVSLVA